MLYLVKVFFELWCYCEVCMWMFWSLDDCVFIFGSYLMWVEGEEGSLVGDMLICLMCDFGVEDYMDLQVGFSDGDVCFIVKYLLIQLLGMNKSLVNWLKMVICSGYVEQGYFQWQGLLNCGVVVEVYVMNFYFKVCDGELVYQFGWFVLSKMVGEVFVEDFGVCVLVFSGNLLNFWVSDVKVDIFFGCLGQMLYLYVDGVVDSNLKDGIKLFQEVLILICKIFVGWEGDGFLQGYLKLDILLDYDEVGKIGVVVDFFIVGVILKMFSLKLDMSEVKGDFWFDLVKGLSVLVVQVWVLGNEVCGWIVVEGCGDVCMCLLFNGQVVVKLLSDWFGVGQCLLLVLGCLLFQFNLLLDGKDS